MKKEEFLGLSYKRKSRGALPIQNTFVIATYYVPASDNHALHC
jgi:hypothetical protein